MLTKTILSRKGRGGNCSRKGRGGNCSRKGRGGNYGKSGFTEIFIIMSVQSLSEIF